MSKLITYPTAKLAKEKGFNELCNYSWETENNLHRTSRPWKNSEDITENACPIQSELQDWFIEKHGVAVLADLNSSFDWIWKIFPLHPEASIQEQFVSSGVHSTKQLALEEGLLKALTALLCVKDMNKNRELNNTYKKLHISDVIDNSKTIAIDFAKWIAENKWYKQIKYDVWEKSGVGSKSSLELFDMFFVNYQN